jgi:hypothetical protein
VTDIKANFATGIDLTPYLDECDSAIIDLAEELGIRTVTDIETNPLHFQVKNYGINYILMRVCEDRMGACQTDTIQFDKYYQLSEFYRKRVADLRSRISAEMITGNVSQIRDRSIMSGMLFRG